MCFDFLYNFSLKHFSLCEEVSEILLQMWSSFYILLTAHLDITSGR